MTAVVLACCLDIASAALLYSSYRMRVRGRPLGDAVLVFVLGAMCGMYSLAAWAAVIFR